MKTPLNLVYGEDAGVGGGRGTELKQRGIWSTLRQLLTFKEQIYIIRKSPGRLQRNQGCLYKYLEIIPTYWHINRNFLPICEIFGVLREF